MADNQLPVAETVKGAWDKTYGAKATLWAIIGIGVLLNLFTTKHASFWNLIIGFISFLVTAAGLYLGIRRAQGIEIKLEDAKVIVDSQIILKILGLYFLIVLIMIVPGVILFTMAAFLGALGMLLAVIIAIPLYLYFIAKLYLCYGLLLMNPNMGLMDIVKKSFDLTKGHELNLIIILVVNILFVIAGTITLLIGLIWVLPYLYVSYGEIYRRLVQPSAIEVIPSSEAIPPPPPPV